MRSAGTVVQSILWLWEEVRQQQQLVSPPAEITRRPRCTVSTVPARSRNWFCLHFVSCSLMKADFQSASSVSCGLQPWRKTQCKLQGWCSEMTVALWLPSDLCQTFSYNLWNWLHQFFYGASHRVTSWKDNHSLPAWCQMHASGQQPWSLGFLCCSAPIDAVVVRDYLDMGLPEHHRQLWLISCSYFIFYLFIYFYLILLFIKYTYQVYFTRMLPSLQSM